MATSYAPMAVDFLGVSTLDDALARLHELGADCTILAGGTDVMVQYLRGEIEAKTLLHIGRLPELEDLTVNDSSTVLGALLTHRTIATDPRLADRLPALAEACATVGGWQTQEVGTIGGNVCNASPAADTLPPLLVADAVVSLASKTGRRSVAIADFITDRRVTSARPDEMVTHLELTPCRRGTGEVYLKVAPRTAMEVAVVGLAVRLTLADGVVTSARLAANAVAPVPLRVSEAEEALVGSRLEGAAVDEAARLVAAAARPIDDNRASAAYRRRVLERLVGRAVGIAHRRATGG